MKQVLFSMLTFLALGSFAQCSSCTISITGHDASDHVVTIGQVLCIASTGTATGHIYVSSGGIVCNQGHINSTALFVSGGGELDNYGVINIDTFYIAGPSTILNNYDSLTTGLFYTGSNVTITNSGTINTSIYGDTASVVINNGSFTSNSDMYLGPNGNFTNNKTLMVKRDFYNATQHTFTTSCMATVQRNWYNLGTIDGPGTGCGGFTITGQSLNSGIVGDTGHIDLCDAGHPSGGIDGNSGTLTGVTYCQCTNTCVTPASIDQPDASTLIFEVYPNPVNDKLQLKWEQEGEVTIILQNLLGERKQQYALQTGIKEMSINTTSLSSGIYLITIQSDSERSSRKVEIVR